MMTCGAMALSQEPAVKESISDVSNGPRANADMGKTKETGVADLAFPLDKTDEHGDQMISTTEDAFSLKVKPEYILSDCHPLLAPQQLSDRSNCNGATENQKQKPNRHKKNIKGMKRSRDSNMANKMCLSIMRGDVCKFGANNCKYNHDLKEALANREEDITALDGGCPIYNLKGFCEYGIMCRFGSSHIHAATGQNLSNDEIAASHQPKVINILSKDVQSQLRKKSYPFVCKRHFEIDHHRKKNGGRGEEGIGLNDAASLLPKRDGMRESSLIHEGVDSENKEEPADIATEIANPNKTDVETIDFKKLKDKLETAAESTSVLSEFMLKPETATAFESAIDLTPLPEKTRKLIDFRNKVYVAPLTTVGNLPFRRIMKKFGADITCGEMAVAQNLLEGKPGEWALLKRHVEEDVFGIQIASGYPDMFTRTAELIEREVQADFVDLNLGCPIDVICEKGAGAALMLRDKKLKACLDGISGVLSCPITIKIRTGWDEKNPIAHNLVPKIQSWGIDGLSAIMIHGRSRLQRYSKLANWDYIQEVANSQTDRFPRISIIGNGDIFSYTDYEKAMEKRVNETAMIARGALIKPWLPTEIKEKRHWDISASERLDLLKDFVKFGLEHWGSDLQGVNNTRRFLLEWLSFLYRYIPVGMLEVIPQQMNQRPPLHMCGRSDLETLMLSKNSADWMKISEMLLGPVGEDFVFEPKHKANGYK